MTTWQTFLSQQRDRYIDDLVSFLRIPSISSLPEHREDVARSADWVATRLRAAGLEEVRVIPTGGHPVVFGHWLRLPDKPTVMIYGHFDVQPVDPIDLWTRDPFDPVIENGRIYARGASDDKGNMLSPILAMEALMQRRRQPVGRGSTGHCYRTPRPVRSASRCKRPRLGPPLRHLRRCDSESHSRAYAADGLFASS